MARTGGILARLSIRLTAPVLLVVPVVLAAAVLVTIGTVQGQAAVERLASQQLTQIHDRIDGHVASVVRLPAQANRINLALLEEGRLDPARPRDWASVFIEQFRAYEALSSISWGSERGDCTWIARYAGDDEHLYYAIQDELTGDTMTEYRVDADGVIASEPSSSFAFDVTTRPWYVPPKVAGRATWSEPYLWAGGADESELTLGIAYGVPYFTRVGALFGVINADLSLTDLSRFLAELRIGRTGEAYIVDENGLLLASSSGAALATDAGKRLRASASERPAIRDSAGRLAASFGGVGQVDRPVEEIVVLDGTAQWMRASPFTHETGLNWVIVTLVPEADFTAEIAAGRRRSAWFTAGVTVGTLGLGVLLSMFLVRPILRLSDHARRIGEGDLDQEIALPYARELDTLSDDLNRMTADLREHLELRRSLALAMEVQQSLLPEAPPRIDGLDIVGHSTYCDDTGGDYYDYLDIEALSGDTAALVVGDVMGHGIAAAMLMATARGILRSRCLEEGSLGDLLGHLNDLLVEVTGGSRFMTMVIVTIDGETGDLRMSSAGHDPPFIYDPTHDAFIELESGGLPLGIVGAQAYPEESWGPLPIGAIVVSSTDGVWEAQSEAGEEYGKERMKNVIREFASGSARDIANAIHESVQAHCGAAKQLDDITFVVAKRGEPGEAGEAGTAGASSEAAGGDADAAAT